MSFLLPSYEEIPPEALPASDTISSPKSDVPASEPFISKGIIEHSSNCEFLPKIYHFLSFWKFFPSSTKLTYTETLSAQIYALSSVRTYRKTHFRLWANLQITLVTMPYHKVMTRSVPLCPHMFSCLCTIVRNPHSSHKDIIILNYAKQLLIYRYYTKVFVSDL